MKKLQLSIITLAISVFLGSGMADAKTPEKGSNKFSTTSSKDKNQSKMDKNPQSNTKTQVPTKHY